MKLKNTAVGKPFLLQLYPLFFILFVLSGCKDRKEPAAPSESNSATPAVFVNIPASESGIAFENNIREDLSTLENLFNFDYFYNGAGVGVEDLNNDGLLDIFFCGNQVGNKLFLNLGDLKFKDVSPGSGINQGKQWANGITFIDINDDGWMDIYVSQGGPNQRLQRKNVLLVNQQDGTFTEEAEAYGLADMGISTQSAFFDLDNDGDLDCIVMNENEYYGVDPISLDQLISKSPEAAYFNSAHLYQNNGGKFDDITITSGIQRPIFGLGLAVHDFDKDGFTDIYIASDYYLPDALFINNGDNTFTDRIKEFTNQISYYGMGMDVADIDNDLREDIFVLDMASSDHIRSKTLMASMNTDRFDYLVHRAGYHYQYMFNSLQYNLGNQKYSNIAQLTGIANTDWSWSVLMSDFDLDEDKDIYITNGYRRYALDNDLQQRVFNARQQYGQNIPLEVKAQLYESMPSEKLPNLLFTNTGDLKFQNSGEEWGLGDYSFSNGVAAGDLDNDGDLDLVVNNMDENAFLYKNGSVENGLGNYLHVTLKGNNTDPEADVLLYYGGKSQLVSPKRVRGYMSAHENAAHFGLGNNEKIDSLVVKWADGRANTLYNPRVNSRIQVSYADSNPPRTTKPKKDVLFEPVAARQLGINFSHKENIFDDFESEVLLPYKQSQWGPPITVGDVDGDGLDDFYIGGASGQAGEVYLQADSGFKKINNPDFTSDRGYEDTNAIFFDFEGDGDNDLFVVSGGNEFAAFSSLYADRVYINDGKGNFSKWENSVLTRYAQSGKAVAGVDFDRDGDMDIIVGNRTIPQQYPRHAPSTLWENTGGNFVDVTEQKASVLLDFGIINDIYPSDIDNDGWPDLIAVGEWGPIGLLKNTNGRFALEDTDLRDQKGWWFSVTGTDLNGDGLEDFILGNVGLNIKFTASKDKPFKVFANDFDNNGTNDIVLGKKYQGKYVPVRGRECSSQQMPFIKDKFPSYREFANATVEDVFGEKLEQSYAREVTGFQSVMLLNRGNFQFEIVALPREAQFYPVLATAVLDVDGDGNKDLITAGNIYETEVETPRLDAISGVVLKNDGNDAIFALPYVDTGLTLNGNIKDLEIISTKNSTLLIATRNNDSPLIYRLVK